MLIQNKKPNPLKGWQVQRENIRYLGQDLQRPECILTEPNGTVWSADARGGVMKLNPDGSQELIAPFFEQITESANSYENRYIQAQGSLPNGVCFDQNGDFIIANWGTNHLERMTREGKMSTLLTEIDGIPLGKTNFPLRDSKGRIWFTVTTRTEPWSDQINSRATDGYIALMDDKGVRIVADGFCGTNEIRFDDNEECLYVVESTGWFISRLRVNADGSLSDREVYGPSRLSGFPDGFAFDTYGNLWITLIFTDQLIALTPDGEELMLLDDSTPSTRQRLIEAYEQHKVTPENLGRYPGQHLSLDGEFEFWGKGFKNCLPG